MPALPAGGRRTLVALVVAVCTAFGWLAARALRDPGTPFLPARTPAAWILYPTPQTPLPQPAVEVDAVFRRTFRLDRRPDTATLRVRWSRRGAVAVNGELAAASSPAGDWKRPLAVDVARLLHPGENTLEARAVAAFGPPALWLSLETQGIRLVTDETWETSLAGASSRPARRAETAMEGALPGQDDPAANPRPADAARAILPLLLVFAGLVLTLLALARAWARRRSGGPLTRGETAALLLGTAVLWGALFWHNRHLSPLWGFDSEAHLEYVRHLLARGSLPLADEGWEMYQPPLYYLAAAVLLRLTGHRAVDAGAMAWIHGLGWACGLLQCGALLAGLRLLFADRLRPLFAGLCLAVFLPMQLYVFQYVSNEGLHAALSTLALYLALRILVRDDTSARSHLLLGAVLGLAMLAKFSALLTGAVVVAVLAGRLAARRVREPAVYARTVGVLALAALGVCGWHYARVARRFGSPLVGNWERASGFAWWMDPGYATAGWFLRFGRSLTAPLFSALHGLPDAIYSTLWGDGLLGGAAVITVRPPWNYGLMAAGYLLALVPTAALLTGLAAALVRLVRAPRSEDFLLLGAVGGTGFAILAMSLKLPFYAQAKAFYGLAAMMGLCALAGEGCEILTRRSRLAAVLIASLLGVWALNAYATFWIVGGRSGDPSGATLAAVDPAGLLGRAETAARQGSAAEQIAWLRRATEIAPDHPVAWAELGAALARGGEAGAAIDALREALRITPRNAQIHGWLTRLYTQAGNPGRARYHQTYADRLAVTSANLDRRR